MVYHHFSWPGESVQLNNWYISALSHCAIFPRSTFKKSHMYRSYVPSQLKKSSGSIQGVKKTFKTLLWVLTEQSDESFMRWKTGRVPVTIIPSPCDKRMINRLFCLHLNYNQRYAGIFCQIPKG